MCDKHVCSGGMHSSHGILIAERIPLHGAPKAWEKEAGAKLYIYVGMILRLGPTVGFLNVLGPSQVSSNLPSALKANQ